MNRRLFAVMAAAMVALSACGSSTTTPIPSPVPTAAHAPTGTPVRVADQPSRILGRISMDMLCVDLSTAPGAHVGSPVVLWGDGPGVDEVASAAGTIAYELLTAISSRVHIEEV